MTFTLTSNKGAAIFGRLSNNQTIHMALGSSLPGTTACWQRDEGIIELLDFSMAPALLPELHHALLTRDKAKGRGA